MKAFVITLALTCAMAQGAASNDSLGNTTVAAHRHHERFNGYDGVNTAVFSINMLGFIVVPGITALVVAPALCACTQKLIQRPDGMSGVDVIAKWLSSPAGVLLNAVVGVTVVAFFNEVWAFDWSRFGISHATSVFIQELGGQLASTASMGLLCLVPLYLYVWQRVSKPNDIPPT